MGSGCWLVRAENPVVHRSLPHGGGFEGVKGHGEKPKHSAMWQGKSLPGGRSLKCGLSCSTDTILEKTGLDDNCQRL